MARELLSIDDARIIYRNFEGRKNEYNEEGERNFCVVLDDQGMINQLVDKGWNVKIKPPRDEDDRPLCYLPVKVSFGRYPPDVYLVSGGSQRILTEENVSLLDRVDILSADMDISPYHWEKGGRSGVSAYLQALRVRQRVNRFAEDMGTRAD